MSYEKKFAEFIRLCKAAKDQKLDMIVVPAPFVLGDNYAEVIRSLNLIAESGVPMSIAGTNPEYKGHDS